jgi:hypothetical protein
MKGFEIMRKKIMSIVLALTLVLSVFATVNANSFFSEDDAFSEYEMTLVDLPTDEEVAHAVSYDISDSEGFSGNAQTEMMVHNDSNIQFNSHGIGFVEVKTQDTWTIIFDDSGVIWDILGLASVNDVYPESLRDSVVNSYGAARFSPFDNVVQKNPSADYLEISRTRNGNRVSQVWNQNATAYVATGNPMANGVMPYIGAAAMHIDVTTKSGVTTASIVRLGTPINFGTPDARENINFNGYTMGSLVIDDRGGASNRTKYWIDIFFGANTPANRTAATNYGLKTSAYFYWEY